jgi:hypothetical protein
MKKSEWILTGGIIVGSASLIIFAAFALFGIENKIIYKSLLFGDLLAFFNFFIGMIFITRGIKKPNKQFLISMYGGILFRLIFLVALFISALIFLEINEISFIFSNLFFYFFYVIIEITYLNHRER